MENTESIGAMLRQEREARELSLQDVQEATKITVQNLSALEEDKFDYFPNRVYARAFLRDYANYIGLDSAALLTQYEEKWHGGKEIAEVRPSSRGSAWKSVGYALLAVLVLGGIAAAAYFLLPAGGWRSESYRERVSAQPSDESKGAVLPKVKDIPTPEPDVTGSEPAKPVDSRDNAAQPAVVSKSTFKIAALMPVWVRVVADGKTVYEGTMAKDEVKSWEEIKVVTIRAGMAGAVQIKVNGETQPPLGSLKEPGQKTFEIPAPASISPTVVPAPPVSPPAAGESASPPVEQGAPAPGSTP
jgi:cytoskeletal protein RodZ